MSLRCIIAGTRTVAWEQTLAAIEACPFRGEITQVVSGCARGPDTHGEVWAARQKIAVQRFPAEWARFGRSAGPTRNRAMARNADALIAVWNGSSPGTAHMIREATRRGLRVFVYRIGRASP